MRWQATLAVGMLLLTTGCTGLGGGAGTETVTPAPVPTDAATDPIPPPGIDRQGLTNPTALATAHRQALANVSYTMHELYIGRSGSGSNESVLRRNETTAVVDLQHYRHELERRQVSRDGTVSTYRQSTYADGERWHERRAGEQVTRHSGTIHFGRDQYAHEAAFYIDQYARGAQSWTVPVERDGRQFHRVILVGGAPAWASLVDQSAEYRVTLLVDANGLVHRLEAHYDTDDERVTYRLWYTDIGATTVQAPAWMATATGTAGPEPEPSQPDDETGERPG